MNLNPINNIKQKIFGGNKKYDIFDIWHTLMIHYGWINFDEFKNTEAYLIDELIIRINKMNENKPLPQNIPRRGRR